jgi:hypothetical protein
MRKKQIILIFGLFRKEIKFIQWETKQWPKSTSTALQIKYPDQTSRPKAISRLQCPRYKNLLIALKKASTQFIIAKWKTMNRLVALLRHSLTKEQVRTNGNWNKKSTSMRRKLISWENTWEVPVAIVSRRLRSREFSGSWKIGMNW